MAVFNPPKPFASPDIVRELGGHRPGLLLALTSKTVRNALHEVRSEAPFAVAPTFMQGQTEEERRDAVLRALELTATQHRLLSIEIPRIRLHTYSRRVAEVLGLCDRLEKLNLAGCDLQNWQWLAPALQRCPRLAHLDISGNFIGDRGAAQLAQSLLLCPVLAHLDLHHCSLLASSVQFLRILRRLPALGYLDLSDNAMHRSHIEALFNALPGCTALHTLVFTHANVRVEEARYLGTRLSRCQSLRRLDLRSNRIGKVGLVDITKHERIAQLTHLNLSWNFIDTINDNGVCLHFTQALQHSPEMAHLVLSHNRLGNGFADALVAVLPACPSLAHLDLEGCFISDAGVENLAAVIPQCATLTTLRLMDNLLTEDAQTRISNAWIAQHGDTTGLFLDILNSQ